MPHPAYYYVKYIILADWPEATLESVNETFTGFGFPEFSEEDFTSIMDGLNPPKAFYPQSKSHRATINYLKKEEVHVLWAWKKDAQEAVDILGLPQVRETVQILLTGRVEVEEISQRIYAKYRKLFSPKAISIYQHYFWKSELLGMQDLRLLLWTHPQRDAYIQSMMGSKNQVLFRAGFSPKIDGRKALREAHRNIAMRIEATRILPDTKDTARMLATLSKELVGVHNALYGEGAGVEDMMRELQRFVMERKAPNVIPINKLAPTGNYSHSGSEE